MKKLKYLLFIVLMLITFNVKATKCESDELARLKELAKKVEFDYDYEVEDGEAVFTINAVNLNEDLKVLIIEDFYNDKYKEFVGETSGSLSGFKTGEKVVITIKGFVINGCSGHTVLTKTIKLPYYNIYYSDELCKDNEDFKYCKKLIDKNITQTEFTKQYNAYLDAKEKANNTEPEKTNEETKDYTKLYIIIGASVLAIIIIVLIVRLIIKRRKKNEL